MSITRNYSFSHQNINQSGQKVIYRSGSPPCEMSLGSFVFPKTMLNQGSCYLSLLHTPESPWIIYHSTEVIRFPRLFSLNRRLMRCAILCKMQLNSIALANLNSNHLLIVLCFCNLYHLVHHIPSTFVGCSAYCTS